MAVSFRKGMFKDVQKQTVMTRSAFLNEKPGDYILRIDNLKLGEDRSFVPQLVMDLTVVRCNFDANNVRPGEEGFAGHRAGDHVKVMTKSSNNYYQKDTAKILNCASGLDPEQLGEVLVFRILGVSADPSEEVTPFFEGIFIAVKAEVVALEKAETDKDGNPEYFNVVNWHSRMTADDLAAQLSTEEKEFFKDAEGVDKIAEWQAFEEQSTLEAYVLSLIGE